MRLNWQELLVDQKVVIVANSFENCMNKTFISCLVWNLFVIFYSYSWMFVFGQVTIRAILVQ